MDSGKEIQEVNSNVDNNSDEKNFSVYLDRLEELEDGTKEAVLLIDDGEEYSAEIVIPAKFLPDDVSDGDYLTIKISYDEDKTKAAFEAAKKLLDNLQ